MKPNIKLIDGVWHCIGQGVSANSWCPSAAYVNWKTEVDCEPGCTPFYTQPTFSSPNRKRAGTLIS